MSDQPETPHTLRRAKRYAAIFIHAGDRWRDYVPVDAVVRGPLVTIDGVHMTPNLTGSEHSWRLETDEGAWLVRGAAS